MQDDPLAHSITVTLNHNSPTSRYVHKLIHCNIDDVQRSLPNLKDKLRTSEYGRVQMYNSVNHLYKVHDNYISSNKLSKVEQVSWTRLRIRGHSLSVVSGIGVGEVPCPQRRDFVPAAESKQKDTSSSIVLALSQYVSSSDLLPGKIYLLKKLMMQLSTISVT